MNHIFILAHKHTKSSNGFDEYNHAFGMTATLVDGKMQASSGLDFGAPYGFDPQGKILEKMTTEAMFLSITEEAFDRFNGLISDLSALHEQQRCPYYFSRVDAINLYMERYHNFTHIEGHPRDPTRIKSGIWDVNLIDAHGNLFHLEEDEYPTHDDMTYVHANCVEMINFAAKQSGIDLEQLAENWWNVGSGAQMSEAITGTFNKGRFKVPGAPDFCFHAHETPAAQVAWKVEHNTKEGVKMSDLIEVVAASKGGHEKMFDFFQGQKPFDRAPAETPAYLQARLDELQDRPNGQVFSL